MLSDYYYIITNSILLIISKGPRTSTLFCANIQFARFGTKQGRITERTSKQINKHTLNYNEITQYILYTEANKIINFTLKTYLVY